MNFLEKLENKHQVRKLQKSEKLRIKNDRLRSQGKEPLKGWNTVVNTGMGGLNRVTSSTGKGIVDMLSKEKGTVNFYAEEQKNVAEEVSRKHKRN